MNRLSLPLVRSRLRARFFSTEKKKPIKIFGGRKKKGGTRKKSPTEQTTATSTTRAHRAHGKPRQTSGAGHTYAPKSRSGYNQKLKQKKTDGHASGDAYAVDAAELAQFRQSQSTYLPLLGVSIPAGALYFILNDLYIGQNSSWSERASSVVQDVHVAVNERRGKTRCDREEEKRQSLTNANADESSYSGILGMFQGWNDLSYFSFIDLAYFRDYFVSAEDEQVQAKHDSTIAPRDKWYSLKYAATDAVNAGVAGVIWGGTRAMFHINYFAPDNIRRNRYLVSQEAKRAAKLAGVGSMLLALLFHCTLELHARGLSYLSSPNTFNTLSTPAIHNNTTAVDISPSLQRNTTPADTPATPNEPEAPMTSLSMAELKAEMESHHWRLTTGSSILHCLSMSYIAYRMPFSLFINLYHTITFPEHALNRWKVMQLDEHGVYTHCDEFGYEENFVPRKD